MREVEKDLNMQIQVQREGERHRLLSIESDHSDVSSDY